MPARLAKGGDNTASSAELARLLDAFEEAIEDLRIAYEKYFLGVERTPPTARHRKVKLHLRQLQKEHMRTTVLRFRMQGLRARLVTYQHYWTRILGQIEKGTYRRDLQMRSARRQEAIAALEKTRRVPEPTPEEAEAAASPSVAAAANPTTPRPPGVPPPPPPPRAGKRPSPAQAVPGMKNTEVKQLFDNLVQAKKAAGEDTQGLTVRALARKLSRELPKLRERHGSKVEFEVATVRGKVRLRARNRDT
ncbi:MAG: MXAN_5187 C-terminal domain-containing protein [Myxococcota bacterium]